MKIHVKFRVYDHPSGKPLGLLTKNIELIGIVPPSSGDFFCYQDGWPPIQAGGASGSLYFYSDRIEFLGGQRYSESGIKALVALGWEWKTWQEIMTTEEEVG